MARLSQWEPYNRAVQAGMVDGRFASAAFTLLGAGPPRLANVGTAALSGNLATAGVHDDLIFPIGVVQNYNLSHNRNIMRIFELGSERSFFISGRTIGQIGLSRILYHGPSILRTMYAYYQDLIPPTVVSSMMPAGIAALAMTNPHDVKIDPGQDNLFLNLASDLFSQPVGLMQIFRDSNETSLGAVYAESCYIPNHSLSTDAQGVIIQESISIQFERLVPLAVSQLQLVDISASDAEINL